MEQTSMFYGSNEMDNQQIRFSSSSEINSIGAPYIEPLAINKRRACSNGYPNQLLLDTSQQYAWAPVSTSSGFGGSNTMAAMTSSFNSVNVSLLADQKPLLSRSLESLAVITGPSTSDALFMMSAQMDMLAGVEGVILQHKDDSRINYSFDYDSGMGNGSANSSATTANESFSSAADSFLSSTNHTQQQQLIDELETQMQQPIDEHQQHFDSAYAEIIDGMQQCRPFQTQLTPSSTNPTNDFEMDEC